MHDGIRFFGDGLPYLKSDDLKGKLIVIEGTDGVGRSTQIDLLEDWLKVQGFGVVVTGWTRSRLMSRSIEMAKNGNMIDRMTLSLLYATDFADRLENEIIPALRSGFVVLCDRYIYTAMARDCLRNADRQWIHDVYGFAPIPHFSCYLRIDVENLIPRVIESGGMNYWESGMDLHLADNIFDCFKKYQHQLIGAYDNMAETFGIEVVDARRSVEEIQQDLRTRVEQVVRGKPAHPVLSLLKNGALKTDEIQGRLENKLSDVVNRLSGVHEAGARRPVPQTDATPPTSVPDDRVIPFSGGWTLADHNSKDFGPKNS